MNERDTIQAPPDTGPHHEIPKAHQHLPADIAGAPAWANELFRRIDGSVAAKFDMLRHTLASFKDETRTKLRSHELEMMELQNKCNECDRWKEVLEERLVAMEAREKQSCPARESIEAVECPNPTNPIR